MHFTSHKALIKSPGEHAVAIEMSQRAGLRHKHTEKRSMGSGCRAAAAQDRAETNKILLILHLKSIHFKDWR